MRRAVLAFYLAAILGGAAARAQDEHHGPVVEPANAAPAADSSTNAPEASAANAQPAPATPANPPADTLAPNASVPNPGLNRCRARHPRRTASRTTSTTSGRPIFISVR
jgi:hypothetical protein